MPGGDFGGGGEPHVVEGQDMPDKRFDQKYPPRGSRHFGAQLQHKTGAEFSIGIELGDPVRQHGLIGRDAALPFWKCGCKIELKIRPVFQFKMDGNFDERRSVPIGCVVTIEGCGPEKACFLQQCVELVGPVADGKPKARHRLTGCGFNNLARVLQ